MASPNTTELTPGENSPTPAQPVSVDSEATANEGSTDPADSNAGCESEQEDNMDTSDDGQDSDCGSKQEDDKSKEEKIDLSKTRLVRDRYLKRYLLWDVKNWRYKPYDPSTRVKKPAKKDTSNYFYVDVRYQTTGSEPSFFITHFSDTLIQGLRSLIGGTFFRSSPEIDVQKIFPDMFCLREALVSARLAVSADTSMTSNEMVTLAKSLGCHQCDDSHGDSEAKTYLSGFEVHLSVFMGFLEEQFKPIAEKLDLVTSHGHIEFELLQFFFEPGQQVTTTDSFGHLVCFEIENRYYSNYTPKTFTVTGYAYKWGGREYVQHHVSRTVEAFEKATAEISSLPYQHLTPQDKEKLRVRGQLYTTYLGVHYRLDNDSRVIVDRMAYNHTGGYTRDPNQVFPDLDDNLLHLLPSEVYGFNLTKKAWASFLVENLKPVVFDDNAWDHLVLDPDIKTLIKGLVEVTKNANSSSKIIGDVISGKGGGLIAVLHGPPGTGKTLTAESVAEILHRPLYIVGSSELPAHASELERSLKAILRLATAWDAVLLIDEADVFLEQRSLHEIERNALVSVALRLLEYHRGVLFLTTNRIKTFDDAFLSRFSIAIKYPELDRAGRHALWCKFIKLAQCEIREEASEEDKECITKADLNELSLREINGRTIKNLVRTAQSLALSSNSPVTMAHVQVVVRAQEKFLNDFVRPTS